MRRSSAVLLHGQTELSLWFDSRRCLDTVNNHGESVVLPKLDGGFCSLSCRELLQRSECGLFERTHLRVPHVNWRKLGSGEQVCEHAIEVREDGTS